MNFSIFSGVQLGAWIPQYLVGCTLPHVRVPGAGGYVSILWLSVLLKDTSVTAGIRTHILLLTPELESGKLDRSATTLRMPSRLSRQNVWHHTFRAIELRSSAELNSMIRARSRSWDLGNKKRRRKSVERRSHKIGSFPVPTDVFEYWADFNVCLK